MIEKFKTKVGWTVYKIPAIKTTLWGGFGICDHCNSSTDFGYLIPVLNHYCCEKCFRDWEKTARFYPEDLEVENKRIKYYENILNIIEKRGKE
ncbi:hypothetical protein FSBG_00178 [Fusobacterium gonidiaformans 3-1-5R]|uniref:Demethylase n=1 Tax=Fusobacterium gonidiaformans 3-1-5R TaxID=469605 RepID=E5BF00_9FUSO|nr:MULTISPECIES: hypothetical protein [Fusobacterium]EFS20681.1 hypothetical protein FSBG_00178 [Fusobacterium gonidiaformans 3-1-5R]KYM58564.1 hypothetical protein A2U09_07860 [Fusobacterium necrophorum subsp. funduliforme]